MCSVRVAFWIMWSFLYPSACIHAGESSVFSEDVTGQFKTVDVPSASGLIKAQRLYEQIVQTKGNFQSEAEQSDGQSGSNLPLLLNVMANSLRSHGHYAESIRCHEAVLGISDAASDRLSASAGIAKARIHFSDPNVPYDPNNTAVEVLMLTNEIVNEFKTAEKAGLKVFEIGEEYYLLGKSFFRSGKTEEGRKAFASALKIWEKNGMLSDPTHAAKAIYFSAVTSSYLGDDVSALAYYQKVARDYPDFEKAGHAKHMAAQLALKLARQGRIDAAFAKGMEIDSYNDLLQNDPNSPVDAIVRKKVQQLAR